MDMNQHDNRDNGDNRQPFDYQEHYRQQNEQYGQKYPDYNEQNHRPYQTTVMNSGDDTKIFSILSYINILWIIGLIADRNNPVVRFHVNQGIILSIFEIAFGIILGIIRTVLGFAFSFSIILSGLGHLLIGLLSIVFWCFAVAFSVIGIIHVVQGRQEPLPIIGSLFTVIR